MNQLTELFERSAAVVAGEEDWSGTDDEVRRLIGTLDYRSADAGESGRRAALLRAAGKLRRVFRLRAPDAPGLVFFGGEADPTTIGRAGSGHPVVGLSGTGLTPRQAFESCIGEGVEYLSQFATAEDVLERARLDERIVALGRHAADFVGALAQRAGLPADHRLAWIAVRRLSDGGMCQLPADMCLRRSRDEQDFVTPFKLSTGCGAGASFASAALHGLCELIERDAVSLWWRGGRRGRAIDRHGKSGRAAADLVAALRGREATGRFSWLLDITSDIGVPCAAALSMRPDGSGLACGHAARATMVTAVRAAIFEMCQMELAYVVVDAKRHESGEAALNEADRRHVRRATLIDARTCEILHPLGESAAIPDGIIHDTAEQGAAETLQTFVHRLARLGIDAFAVELTRPLFAIPVVRILAPALQLEPSDIVSDRLAASIAVTGGGQQYTGGVALL